MNWKDTLVLVILLALVFISVVGHWNINIHWSDENERFILVWDTTEYDDTPFTTGRYSETHTFLLPKWFNFLRWKK